MKYLMIAFLSFILASSCASLIEETIVLDCVIQEDLLSHPDSTTFQELLDEFVSMGLPGIALQIMSPEGTWTGAAGLADIQEKTPFTACHTSKTGSITKLMIGTLLLKLHEEGVLSIDDPISDYIDAKVLDQLNMVPDVRIRNLMNHTTGIYDHIENADFYLRVINFPSKDWTALELLEYAYGQDAYELTEALPARYSNTNTVLLSMCIEAATNEAHGKLLRSKIIDPLGLSSSYYSGFEKLPESTAQGYFDIHNNGELFNVSNLNTGNGNGYTGIYSSAIDLSYFIRALFDDQTILADETLALMLDKPVPVSFDEDSGDISKAGLGVFKKYHHLSAYGIGHEGGDLGYAANVFYFPEKDVSMAYVVNYGTNGDSAIRPVFNAFDKALVDQLIGE